MHEKKVMVFGTFDGLHDGHRAFLREAKQHGKHLIIVVARDSSIAKVYGKKPTQDEITRISTLLADGVAQDIVMGHEEDKLRVLKEHKPHIIVLGFTQKKLVDSLHKKAQEYGLDGLDITIARPHDPEKFPPSDFTSEHVHLL